MKNVLVVVAHPDDEVLGMGGTIAKLTSEGSKVSVLITTDGSTAQYRNNLNLDGIIKEKKRETANAAKILGLSKIIYGGLPDMRLDVTPHTVVNEIIEKTIAEVCPDTVFTHFWGDVNLDHQCVFRSVLVAVRPFPGQTVKGLYCFRVPSSTEWSPSLPSAAFTPNTYVDISNYSETKYKAFAAYTHELRAYPHPRSLQYLKESDVAEGLKVGIDAAESFIQLRNII